MREYFGANLNHERTNAAFQVYNVATPDSITVREIADVAVECLGLAPGSVRYQFSGGERGWKGDVPVVRLNVERICALGWICQRPTRDALRLSIQSILVDGRAGKFDK